MSDVKFGIIDSKERFLNLLNSNEIPEGSIILIQDTKELWMHGTFISASIELYNGLDAVDPGKALDAVQGRVLFEKLLELSSTIESSKMSNHVVLTQSEYDELVAEGQISDSTFYYIIES